VTSDLTVTATNPSRETTGPILVTFAAMLWAVDAPFRKLLTIELSSPAIVLMEHLMVSVCVLPLLLTRVGELKRLTLRGWLAVIFVSCGGSALATMLFTQSFRYLNPTVAILLQKLQPLIGIALAAVILKERSSKDFWLWALVAVCGAYLVSFPSLKPSGLTWNSDMLGVVLALGAAFLWAGSTVFGRFVLNSVEYQVLTALRFLPALVLLIAVNVFSGTLRQVAAASSRDWLFVFMTAIIGGFISLLIYYYGLRYTRASVATVCELGYPLAAVVVNWKFLEAALSPMQVAGGCILIVAIARLSVVNEQEIQVASRGLGDGKESDLALEDSRRIQQSRA
jgi:drug/metabolite transporter (DMT)-like permease